MKKLVVRLTAAAVIFFTIAALMSFKAEKAYGYVVNDDGRIKDGIYAGAIDLSGMSGDEARSAVSKYIAGLSGMTVRLNTVDDNFVEVSAGSLGMTWKNPEIIDEATALGREGNIVARFKELKDLERSGKVYDIKLQFDENSIKNIISEKCTIYDRTAVDASLKRESGSFTVTPGQDGVAVDIDASVTKIKDYMETLWTRGAADIELATVTVEPRGRTEDLEQVKDVLGTFTTNFSTSASGRSANVRNGCSLINGTLLYPGEQLSVYEKVSPFTEENGYYLAGSYNNGLVVETLGGGICQVSSTLYNAVIRAELQVDERSNHSMVVSYVDLSADAAISGTSKDFKFTNNSEYPIYIAGSTSDEKKITFTIYGKETRPENRTLEFESEMLSETVPEGEKIIADPSQPVGYSTSQSAHTGYTANYWKIVKVDGQETDRVKLNSSTYMSSPRTVTYGTGGDVTGAMSAAISTQSSDYCSAVAAQLVNAANAANIAAAEQAAEAVAEEAQD